MRWCGAWPATPACGSSSSGDWGTKPWEEVAPAATPPTRPPAPPALHAVDLHAGAAPEVVGAVPVNQSLLACPAGLDHRHSSLLAIDAAELRKSEQRSGEGSPPHEALGAPKNLGRHRAVQLRGLDVDDTAQEVHDLVVPLLDEPHPGDGLVDVPDPVVARVADVQVPVLEGGRPWRRGSPGRSHGDAATHAVEDRDVLDGGPASRAHACFREEAVHDPSAEGLLVVLGDLDPRDLGHVSAPH